MIIKLTNIDISVLCLHMSIMRKRVKSGFKINYGKEAGKEKIASFDKVKIALEDILNENEDLEKIDLDKEQTLHFNINEIEMLDSFLAFYYTRLNDTLLQAGKIHDEDQGQLDSLLFTKQQVSKAKDKQLVGNII